MIPIEVLPHPVVKKHIKIKRLRYLCGFVVYELKLAISKKYDTQRLE